MLPDGDDSTCDDVRVDVACWNDKKICFYTFRLPRTVPHGANIINVEAILLLFTWLICEASRREALLEHETRQ